MSERQSVSGAPEVTLPSPLPSPSSGAALRDGPVSRAGQVGTLREGRAKFSGPAVGAAAVTAALDARQEWIAAGQASGGAVLSEELFRSALVRERKRADRFEQAFALVTVTLAGGREQSGAPALVEQVTAALAAAARETDIVGWVEDGAVLGVTYAEVAAATDGSAIQLKARLQRELERRVDPAGRATLQVRWYFHAAPGSGGTEGLHEDDPLVEDLRLVQKRYTLIDCGKRALDLAGSSLLLVLLSPLFLLLAALVRLTSAGPVFFRQVRVGHLGKPFTMLKFRTMQAHADPAVHQQYVTEFIRAGTPAAQADGEKVFKLVNDTRITRIGRLLRGTSLDELPQLWNVFRGDMSLVGPRPPLRYELEQYRPWHWRRVLEGKPGLTGLWQVTGRSRTSFDEMVRLDIRYVRMRSLWTDIRILLATPRAAVTGKGAV
jgi:lipopolysaccharide/colanic/teichoic acid biosynthesis glycosyltransferase